MTPHHQKQFLDYEVMRKISVLIENILEYQKYNALSAVENELLNRSIFELDNARKYISGAYDVREIQERLKVTVPELKKSEKSS